MCLFTVFLLLFLCFLSFLLSSAVLSLVLALRSPAVSRFCWNHWILHSFFFCLLWSHFDQCESEVRHAAVLWKHCRDRREAGEHSSAWFQLRAFLICLWSAQLWQPAIHDDMFFFIYVWLLLLWFIGLCQQYDIQQCALFILQVVIWCVFFCPPRGASIWMERIMFL